MSRTEQDYNNAGVIYMKAGRFKEAWDLFKGALELHLARERRRADPNAAISNTSETFILRADTRYQRYVSLVGGREDADLLQPVLTGEHGEDENFCHLFVFRTPVDIPDDLPESAKPSFSGLIIILNLALLEHYRNPFSSQVISLYGLAASLLSGNSREDHLEAFIVNNAGVWHQQNGNASIAEKYMARLATLSRKLSPDSWLTPGAQDGIKFNLDWFANPRYRVSPAA